MKMIFNYDANKTHFHNKGFALSLVLKVRFFGTRKWPIRVEPPFLLLTKEENRGLCWQGSRTYTELQMSAQKSQTLISVKAL